MQINTSDNYVRKNEIIEDNKKKSKIIAAVIAVIVVIFAIIFAISWKKGYRTIKLLEIFKKVSFDRGNQKNVDVYENMSLKAGDTLRTGDDGSYARLVLDGDKYIYMEENSEVVFEMAGRKSSSRTTLHLNYGGIFNELDTKLTDKQTYEIESPNSLMAVRGTKFRASTYMGSDGILYTRVSVLEGKVECWLKYPDGTISSESHMAEVGSEILIYYDEESGITDFARINEAGRYNSKEVGEYARSISFAQMPKQMLSFMSLRAMELGGRFDAISSDELLGFASDMLKDEPILERYGISERQLIDEGLLNHVRGEEKEEIQEKYAKAYLESQKDNAGETLPLDNMVEVDTINDNPTAIKNENSEIIDSKEEINNEAQNTEPEKELTLEEQLAKQIEELLKDPEVVARLLQQQADKKAAEEAEALAAYQAAASSGSSSSSSDEEHRRSPESAPQGGGGGTSGTQGYDPTGGTLSPPSGVASYESYIGYDSAGGGAEGARIIPASGNGLGYTARTNPTNNQLEWVQDPAGPAGYGSPDPDYDSSTGELKGYKPAYTDFTGNGYIDRLTYEISQESGVTKLKIFEEDGQSDGSFASPFQKDTLTLQSDGSWGPS